jgi:hypothetical protein
MVLKNPSERVIISAVILKSLNFIKLLSGDETLKDSE